jgi:hypothetical protein
MGPRGGVHVLGNRNLLSLLGAKHEAPSLNPPAGRVFMSRGGKGLARRRNRRMQPESRSSRTRKKQDSIKRDKPVRDKIRKQDGHEANKHCLLLRGALFRDMNTEICGGQPTRGSDNSGSNTSP